jgi:hypothetical protein
MSGLEASYQETLMAFQCGVVSGPELISCYLIEQTKRRAGPIWRQGRRISALSHVSSPSLDLIAEQRLYKIPEPAAQALCAWSLEQRCVELLFAVPTPLEILTLQAQGKRCVSLVADELIPKNYKDGADFICHDLCHLEKFYDPKQHNAQRGFFSMLLRLLANPEWRVLDATLDQAWREVSAHVIADMNGSPLFLWTVFKAGLRPALHRLEHPGVRFDPHIESLRYQEVLAKVCDWMGLAGEAKQDAILVSDCSHHHREESVRLQQYFDRWLVL